MEATLQEFLNTGVFAFILSFVRLGTAFMIMPGIGDSFVSERIRLLTSFALCFVLLPVTMQYMPAEIPGTFNLILVVLGEFVIGLFFGTVARIFMMATDTAGMVVSTTSGLGNAQIFNPSMAAQGSLIGAFLSVTAVVVLFSLNMHHLLISAIVDSYNLFPMAQMIDFGSMAEFIARAISASFSIGVKMGAPFIILTLLVYVGMGVLSRVMPQVQVFLIALPIQILLSLMLLAMVLFTMLAYWAGQFEEGMIFLLTR